MLTAFAMRMPAHAITINLINGDANTVSGSGRMVDAARPVGAFSVLRLDSSVNVHAHQGATPGDAFYVKSAAETNPPEVVDAGQVVILVGIVRLMMGGGIF